MKEIKWLKARCPVCGREYEYLPDYQPKTCASFGCVHKYHHHPELYRPLSEMIDEARIKTGVK